MSSPDRTERHRIVIVGGGVAALEAVLALGDLAGDRVRITVISPDPSFTLRPLDVARPFARGHADQIDLAGFMAERSGDFRCASVLRVDPLHHVVRCSTGPDEPYDSLIVTVGAVARPAYEHAFTFGADPLLLGGLLADLEQEYSHSVAFVVPPGNTWPLPLYELALMTAEEVWSMGIDDARLHLVTPEKTPLGIFGPEASRAVGDLLSAARIMLHPGISAEVPRNGHIDTGFASGIEAERIVSLPVLHGPRLDGLPCDDHGFIPVDPHGQVVGVSGVYAAGDATDHAVKQGGLACQQADAVAEHVAAAVGAAVDPRPYVPRLQGRLLTGEGDRFLRREGRAGPSEVAAEPLWWPPAKVSGRYLAPYLEEQDLVRLPLHEGGGARGIDVEVAVDGAAVAAAHDAAGNADDTDRGRTA